MCSSGVWHPCAAEPGSGVAQFSQHFSIWTTEKLVSWTSFTFIWHKCTSHFIIYLFFLPSHLFKSIKLLFGGKVILNKNTKTMELHHSFKNSAQGLFPFFVSPAAWLQKKWRVSLLLLCTPATHVGNPGNSRPSTTIVESMNKWISASGRARPGYEPKRRLMSGEESRAMDENQKKIMMHCLIYMWILLMFHKRRREQ